MNLDVKQVAQMLDASVLKTTNSKADLDELIRAAKEHNFICVFSLPCFLPELVAAMKDLPIHVGAPIGFPTGAEPTAVKVFQAKASYELGCDEFDMVMNVGWLKSGWYKKVLQDIEAVKASINQKPLKVIIESMYLTESEIVDASKIVLDSAADYLKSGTGWANAPTTLKHIEIMTNTVVGKIKVKAAGGIRDYETLCAMHELGVSRFGVGVKSGIEIMQQVAAANK